MNNNITVGQGFGIEMLITFVLVLVVFAAAADENNTANVGDIISIREMKATHTQAD